MIGASCAYAAAIAGLNVTVIDRAGVAAGTTGAGEGNILVSDKEPGSELDLALWSIGIWRPCRRERAARSGRPHGPRRAAAGRGSRRPAGGRAA
jgi:glycine/D-amino acid oxidase-like deaminating enzyme